MKEYYDVIIVGTGAAGLYCALNLLYLQLIASNYFPLSFIFVLIPASFLYNFSLILNILFVNGL